MLVVGGVECLAAVRFALFVGVVGCVAMVDVLFFFFGGVVCLALGFFFCWRCKGVLLNGGFVCW